MHFKITKKQLCDLYYTCPHCLGVVAYCMLFIFMSNVMFYINVPYTLCHELENLCTLKLQRSNFR